MGQLLVDQPSNIQLHGEGRRAGTLRSRVRSMTNHLNWLAHHYQVWFPNCTWPFRGLPQSSSLSEPCTRAALKNTHQAFKFLEDSQGIPATSKVSNTTIFSGTKQDLLAAALPGTIPRQAPSMFVSMPAALGDLISDTTTPPYFRASGWWILVQSQGTMRFSDPRSVGLSHSQQDNRIRVRLGRSSQSH